MFVLTLLYTGTIIVARCALHSELLKQRGWETARINFYKTVTTYRDIASKSPFFR
jgi:hypothetical protein